MQIPRRNARTAPLILSALMAWSVCSIASEPAQSPQSLIESRRAGFKKMGAAMKALSEQLKSDSPDSARISAATQVITVGAQEQFKWFPAGSGSESGGETDALPHIWKEPEKFAALADRLVTESKSLAALAAGSDFAAIRTQMKVVADVCSSCHRSFRAD